ncbi:MAG: anti-sigma F factor [Clostridiales bacterium]|nr:anti-sigma F factor [Clostridiales bacterium]
MMNEVKMEFSAISENEGFARMAAAAFVAPLNPTMEEMADIKTAVSEAVTNAIIHGYEGKNGTVFMTMRRIEQEIYLEIRDDGCGIEDIDRAMEPLYTTKGEMERSGMGFSFMEAFMDRLEVQSEVGKGTVVSMWKVLGREMGYGND